MANELTEQEKAANEWYFKHFDPDHYKTIRLLNHGKVIKLYTTLNAWYSDDEDADVAFETAARFGEHVTSVAVGYKRYKMIGGKVRRIANMEVSK
ncbi:hypothetical protein [Lacticaseibacillus suilingensis]|uniref:hypothetical protein n=1 Tax=Lacticaseibacillus suilingensis TaxID=2799577 RepID=UPI0022DED816|nr:hypothetical protein [Lacticaseibacillus suilingensis]